MKKPKTYPLTIRVDFNDYKKLKKLKLNMREHFEPWVKELIRVNERPVK